MIPILHNSRYDGTTNTVIGRLSDCISCAVVEELNGQYELEIEYVTNGANAKELKTGRVILVQADDRITNVQPFRIYNVRTDVTGRTVVNAHHISYDLNKMVINPFTATGIANVISAIPTNIEKRSIDLLPWAFQSNLTNTTSEVNLKYPKNLRSFLGGSEGSLLDVFGGEFEWDGFTVKLNSSRGEYRNVHIRYGVNLTDLEKVEQYDDTYSHVKCYYYDQENDVNVQMNGAVGVSDLSQYESDLIQSRTRLIDATESFQDSVPTATDLRNLAIVYANKMSASPSIGVNVEFVDLRSAGEDTGISNIVRLGDTVNVVYNPLEISEVKKIVKTTWNVLAGRYDQLVIGKPEASLGQTISEFSSGDGSSVGGSGGGGSAVKSVNGHTGDVVLTYRDVGALANTTVIPSKTSQLTNDSGYVTSSSIPTRTSQLTNDSGFITSTSGLVTDPNYVHTDNNYTTAEKTKLSGIEEGAEVNLVDDVTINKSSIVSNKVANIPYAGTNQFGVIAVDVANEPGSKYAKISYDDPLHPAGEPSHSKDVYLPLMPSANSPFPYWYLPDATHTQKGAVVLKRWTGSITDDVDEWGGEGYDSTVGGIVRTITTDDGGFTLTAGNRVIFDCANTMGETFMGYYRHFLNVDGTGAKELMFAPNQQVYTGKYNNVLSGIIEADYDGTYFMIVNGYRSTIPYATATEFGGVKFNHLYDGGGKLIALTGNDLQTVYAPMLTSTSDTIRPSYLPTATSSTQGAVIVDNAMSDSSTNPVSNSVIKAYIDASQGSMVAITNAEIDALFT